MLHHLSTNTVRADLLGSPGEPGTAGFTPLGQTWCVLADATLDVARVSTGVILVAAALLVMQRAAAAVLEVTSTEGRVHSRQPPPSPPPRLLLLRG